MIPPFVDAAWLADHPRAVTADVRWYPDGRDPRQAYDAGHLPGAVLVDLEAVLAGAPTDAGGRHPLPDPQSFADAMGALGVGDDDVVVAHDDAGGVLAARLVWMLRVTGHDAALLDGGAAAAGGAVSTEPVVRPATTFVARPWPLERLAGIDEVAALAGTGRVLLDARPAGRYRGDGDDPLDPRAGHVPGAVSLPARENVDADGRLLPVDVLRERLAAAGVGGGSSSGADGGGGTDVVSSCGSGVTACHTLLVVEHAGLGSGRLFPGSFSAWSRDPARPVATGAQPHGHATPEERR